MQAYGKRAYLLTTLREVPRGTEGAVSLEGSAAGIAAAGGFAGLSCLLGLVRLPGHACCMLHIRRGFPIQEQALRS